MKYDAVVIGAGPNGLSAAIEFARSGHSVCILEASETIGGGTRTAELTLAGFHHDVCSAIHPMAVASPFFRQLSLEQFGLDWAFPPADLAHPLPDGTAAILYKDLAKTAGNLGADGREWEKLFAPFLRSPLDFFAQILKPIRFPSDPLMLARFGLVGIQACTSFVKHHFKTPKAKALFGGCAAHSFLPLESRITASFGLVLALGAHAVGWPFAVGGSQRIADALAACLKKSGGEIKTGHRVSSLKDLPDASVYLFDVTPRQLIQIAGDQLPGNYKKRLAAFQYGPGVFKVDWALNGPIPWKNPDCALAATVHVGGTIEEIAQGEAEIWQNKHPENPFVLLAQQSLFDQSRAPSGKHTVWGYCHVPSGSDVDMTERIERQIERFAPGFRDLILARHTFNSGQMEAYNSNYIGGDITGGANNLMQVIARPILRLNPYSTPNPKIYICSSSTPPGGGVHGMCGHLAACSALRKL